MDGFGVERGLLVDNPKPDFHFQNFHTRATKKAVRDKRQNPAEVGKGSWKDRPPIKIGQKTRPNTVRTSTGCSWGAAVGFGGELVEEVWKGDIGRGLGVGMDVGSHV